MRVAALWLALAALVAPLALGAREPGPAGDPAPLVIVLSWDGTRHDYPERADTPALDRMARDGARASALTPVFPTNTFPNHVALATGTYVDRHGIVANAFADRERGLFSYSNDASWIESEPIWCAAERQGVTAAVFFWVGSETDWNGVGATYRRAPFHNPLPESEKVDQILAWVDLPAPQRPGLILSWWRGADSVGHDRGPDDRAIADPLERQDAELGRLLAELDRRDAWSFATLFVVSDHGMTEVRASVDALGALEAQGIAAREVPGGGTAYYWLDDPTQVADAVAALDALDGVSAYPSDALPETLRAYHPLRSGHVVAIAEPPAVIQRLSTLERLVASGRRLLGGGRGSHGYRPDHPDMGAVFFALGRGVAPGAELGRVHATDVAPTVAALLGIDPPYQSEGELIPGIRAPH